MRHWRVIEGWALDGEQPSPRVVARRTMKALECDGVDPTICQEVVGRLLDEIHLGHGGAPPKDPGFDIDSASWDDLISIHTRARLPRRAFAGVLRSILLEEGVPALACEYLHKRLTGRMRAEKKRPPDTPEQKWFKVYERSRVGTSVRQKRAEYTTVRSPAPQTLTLSGEFDSQIVAVDTPKDWVLISPGEWKLRAPLRCAIRDVAHHEGLSEKRVQRIWKHFPNKNR